MMGVEGIWTRLFGEHKKLGALRGGGDIVNFVSITGKILNRTAFAGGRLV
jgi:hypothetical protein